MDVNRRGRSDIYWNQFEGWGFYSRKWRFKLRQTLLRRSNFTDQKLWAVCIPPIPNYGFCSHQREINYSLPFFISRLVPSITDNRLWDKYINGIDMTLMFDYKPGLFDCKSESIKRHLTWCFLQCMQYFILFNVKNPNFVIFGFWALY